LSRSQTRTTTSTWPLRWTADPSNERQIFSAWLGRHHIFDPRSHQHFEVHAANVAASSIRTPEWRGRRGKEAKHQDADETTSAVASNPLPPRDVLLDARLVRAVPICRRAIKSDDGVSICSDFSCTICGDALLFENKSYASASAYFCWVDDAASRPFDAHVHSG
jgi:hypothetical protein